MAKRKGQRRAAGKAGKSRRGVGGGTGGRPGRKPARKAGAKAGGKASAKAGAKGKASAKGKAGVKGKAGAKGKVRRRRPVGRVGSPMGGFPVDLADRPLPSARLTGGDVDADVERAASSGEEAVGGSEPTPDQDVVDMIGDALGVGRAPDAQVIMSRDILEGRDRRRRRAEFEPPAEDIP